MSMAAVKYTTTPAERPMPSTKNFTASFEMIAVTPVSVQQKAQFHFSEFNIVKPDSPQDNGATTAHNGLLHELEHTSVVAQPEAATPQAEPDVNIDDLMAQLADMGIDLNDTHALEELAQTLDMHAASAASAGNGFNFDAHGSVNIDSAFDHVVNTHVDFSHHMANSVDAIAVFTHAEATVVTDMDQHLAISEVIL